MDLKSLEHDSGIPQELISRIKKLMFILPKLTIHPYNWGRSLSYKFEKEGFKTISIQTFINELDNFIKFSNSIIIPNLTRLRDRLLILYNNLNETNRYGEESPYLRKTKHYLIIELIKKLKKEYFNTELVIGVFDGKEKNILIKIINCYLGQDNGIIVKTIKQINYFTESTNSKILILPSYLPTAYFSEYFKDYKKIIIMSYGGDEEYQCREQLKLIDFANSSYIDKTIDYFEEIYHTLNWQQDGFIESIKAFKKRDAVIETKEKSKELTFIDNIKEKIKSGKEFQDLKENDILFDESNDDLFFELDSPIIKKDYLILLSSIEDDEIKQLEVSKTKTLLYINKDKEIEERGIKTLEPDDLIILFEGDERRSYIDYLAKRSGIEEEIDLYQIKNWKERLNQFAENSNLSDDQLFVKYKQLGGDVTTNPFRRWKDSVQNIAPLWKNDLKLIGEMIGYSFSDIDSLFEDITKLRTTNRNIGRQINKIVKEKLIGNTANLSFEDFDIATQLKIYKIKTIRTAI